MVKKTLHHPLFQPFLLLFLLLIPNLFYFFILHRKGFILLQENLTAIVLTLLFFRWKYTKFLGYITLLLFVIDNSLDIFSIYFYREPFGVVMALSILSTNTREAFEMFSNYWLSSIFPIIYFYLLYKALRSETISKISYKLLLPLFVVLIYPSAKMMYSKANHKNIDFDKLGGNTISLYLHDTPFPTMAPILDAYTCLHDIDKIEQTPFEFPPFEIEDSNIENIIVVIGESAQREALSLYGNSTKTTPLIEKRLDNLLVYNQAIAPSSFTNTAVSLLLSKQLPNDNFSIEKNRDNLISLANATDLWETYWLSSQEVLGTYVNLFSTMNRKAKNKAWTLLHSHDEELLPLLDNAISDEHRKRLIFVHINGSHALAEQRYPAEFDVFSDQKDFINFYNNSIYYTDFVLDQIIKRVENTPSVVLYLSDHGQSVSNDSYYHHSFTQKGVEVPFFIWHSNLVDPDFQVKGSIDAPFSLTNLYTIVTDYMGIKGLPPKPKNEELLVLSPSIETVPYAKLPKDVKK